MRLIPTRGIVEAGGTGCSVGCRAIESHAWRFWPAPDQRLEQLDADEAHVLGDITQPLDLLVEQVATQFQATSGRSEHEVTSARAQTASTAAPAGLTYEGFPPGPRNGRHVHP